MKTNDLLRGDTILWIVYLLLCMLSLVEVFSASATLTYKSGDHLAPITNHCIILGAGAVTVYLTHLVPAKYFRLIPPVGYPVACILLVVVMVMGLAAGVRVNGAARWLWGFQPSELAKCTLVTSVAYILGKHQHEEGCSLKAFKPILWRTAIVFLLIAPENGSTALLLATVIFLMMIIGRIPGVQMGKLIVFTLLAAALSVGTVMSIPAAKYTDKPLMHRVGTWQNRIREFISDNGTVPAAKYDTDKNAQRAHANIAIAESHLLGKGPGNSTQREFLPQAYSDFIYAIIIEEFGLLGGGFVVLLYIILLFRAGRIARKCTSPFYSFLVMGLTLLIVLQAMANMWVATGLLPVTGQPLPMLSKGGSSIFMTSLYFGMIISVSQITQSENENHSAQQTTEESVPQI